MGRYRSIFGPLLVLLFACGAFADDLGEPSSLRESYDPDLTSAMKRELNQLGLGSAVAADFVQHALCALLNLKESRR